MRIIFGVVLAGFALTAACSKQPELTSGIDLKGIDKSAAPGDEFNLYANGAWVKATPIPDDKAGYGAGAILQDETRQRLQLLVQGAGGKIGDYYAAYMDESGIEARGTAPLKPLLDEIATINDKQALSKKLGSQLRADTDALNNTNYQTANLFGIWITQGLQDPTKTYAYLMQGGLGLPDQAYYVDNSPKMAEIRKAYAAHIEAMFKLAGMSEATQRAARVFDLETKMAKAHATRVESEDVTKPVVWKKSELAAKAPGLDWAALLEAAQLNGEDAFFIWHPKAIPGLSALTASEPLATWKDWLAYHTIVNSSPYLPQAFVNENFNFFGRTLSGTLVLRERWQRGVDITSGALGGLVGKAYVDKYFPAESKTRIQAMVTDLSKAFEKRIDALTWMSPDTKAKAKQKLATLVVGVGYPDKWDDYSSLEVNKADPLGNAQRASLFAYKQQLAKLHQKIDKGEWWMTPQTVNAVNLPLQNALNFPAAILQPPYFDPKADAAHNYGAIGAVIGHEISHSFDDQGAQFDAEGKLQNWWTKEDFEHFKGAGEALAAQFDTYKPFPDLAVNGHQTLSENIADVAGLLAAYDAYRLSLGGKEDAVKDGFTGDQRFFISFAQSWRTAFREAELRRRIATDGHAPATYRALTVRNLDAWYNAFKVAPTNKLFLAPDARVHVW